LLNLYDKYIILCYNILHMNGDEIKHLATLARLRVSDEKAEEFASQIGGILKYISEINAVSGDLGNPSDLHKDSTHVNIFKGDELSSLSNEEKNNIKNNILDNAPLRSGDSVAVSKVIK